MCEFLRNNLRKLDKVLMKQVTQTKKKHRLRKQHRGSEQKH